MPGLQAGFYWAHFNTVYWARFYAEVAAGAFTGDDGVHVLGGAENSVYGAGLNALGAAYAFRFANECNRRYSFCLLYTSPSPRDS